jgi:hypothetical protein
VLRAFAETLLALARGNPCHAIPPLFSHDGLCRSHWRALPLGCADSHPYDDTPQRPRLTLGRAAADALPTVPRHKVRVRGVETEFCKRGQQIPEWWHFPECDRHYYFAPEDDASSSAPAHAPHVMPPPALPLCFVQSAAQHCLRRLVFSSNTLARICACVNMRNGTEHARVLTAQMRPQDTPARETHAKMPGAGRRSSTAPEQAAKQDNRPGGKSGYCVLCKVKHDNAKKHADSRAHRQLVTSLMAQQQPERPAKAQPKQRSARTCAVPLKLDLSPAVSPRASLPAPTVSVSGW